MDAEARTLGDKPPPSTLRIRNNFSALSDISDHTARLSGALDCDISLKSIRPPAQLKIVQFSLTVVKR